MYLFFVTEAVELFPAGREAEGRRQAYRLTPVGPGDTAGPADAVRLSPPRNGCATTATLYVAFSRPLLRDLAAARGADGRPIVRVLPARVQDEVLARPGLPRLLGSRGGGEAACLEAQLAAWAAERADGRAAPAGDRADAPVTIAIVNPFGFALGDSVVLLTALREFMRRVRRHFPRVALDILQHADNPETGPLYLRSRCVRGVAGLPLALDRFARYDAYVDLSLPPPTEHVGWVDTMLAMLGIAPATVAARRKRNRVPVRPHVAAEVSAAIAADRRRSGRLLLFHPEASTALRSMPRSTARELLDRLLRGTAWTIVTTRGPRLRHPRVLDWSPLAPDFERWCALLRDVDAVLCVDTAAYHVASAWRKPGVVLFTSVDPPARLLHYPELLGIGVGTDGSRLRDRSESSDAAELAQVAAAWRRLDLGLVVDALHAQAVRHGVLRAAASAPGRRRRAASPVGRTPMPAMADRARDPHRHSPS